MNPTSARMRQHHLQSLCFSSRSKGSSNTDVLDLPCLLVLITRKRHNADNTVRLNQIVTNYLIMSSNSFTGPLIDIHPVDTEAMIHIESSLSPPYRSAVYDDRQLEGSIRQLRILKSITLKCSAESQDNA
ncbi:hypothetical protein Tco_0720337 [Tanacetum coccineum]